MNKATIFLALGALALMGIGCSPATKIQERAIERQVEKESGGDLDLDLNEGSATYEADGTRVEVGQGVSVPSDWPSDFPIPNGLNIVMIGTSEEGAVGSMTAESNQSVEDLIAWYTNELTEGGFTKESDMNFGGASVAAYTKGDMTISISVSTSDNEDSDYTTFLIGSFDSGN